MAILSFNNVSLSFGGPSIFDGLNLQVEKGERLCLLGRNGAGKSSLFKLITKEYLPDDGTIAFQQELKISLMNQEVPQNVHGSVFEVVGGGLEADVSILSKYHDVLHELDQNPEDSSLFGELERVQSQIEEKNLWDVDTSINKVLSMLNIDGELQFENLSGGRKRRVWLARALVSDPDLLLLDEPTNHVDVETVQWLEDFFSTYKGSIIFISHDRAFISKLAGRIIDLDRGKISSWPGSYEHFIEKKLESLEIEATQNALFDKNLAKEEVWIRQGIKARRTRNEGRVRELKALREERGRRREKQGQAKFNIESLEKSGKIVIEAKKLNYSINTQPTLSTNDDAKTETLQLVKDYSTLITRGDKVGVIGPNGVGKSTLIKLLLGELDPDSGSIKTGTNLEVAYFDQFRMTLAEDKTVIENIVQGSDFIEFQDRKVHVISYLNEFLFPKDRMRSPVSALSGGERNRLLLAKLFSRTCNLLVLDEPTNDLDIETLELLEEKLLEFKGTLLLISHDRAFLNNVVTSTIVFENGEINEYVGGYDDWISQRPTVTAVGTSPSNERSQGAEVEKPVASTKRKLSYKDQKELEALPQLIETLETDIRDTQQKLQEPDLYKKDPDQASTLGKVLSSKEALLSEAYQRWDELDS